MKNLTLELSNEEIKAILYAIEQSDVKEIISKRYAWNEPISKGLISAEYKLRKITKNQ